MIRQPLDNIDGLFFMVMFVLIIIVQVITLDHIVKIEKTSVPKIEVQE